MHIFLLIVLSKYFFKVTKRDFSLAFEQVPEQLRQWQSWSKDCRAAGREALHFRSCECLNGDRIKILKRWSSLEQQHLFLVGCTEHISPLETAVFKGKANTKPSSYLWGGEVSFQKCVCEPAGMRAQVRFLQTA